MLLSTLTYVRGITYISPGHTYELWFIILRIFQGGFHRHQSKKNSEHTHCEKLLVVKVGGCKKWRPVQVAGFSNIFVICTEILERLRANQNRGNLGAGSWEEVHKPGSGTSDFRFAPPSPHVWSQLPAPSSQIHRSDWSSAGSWELGGPYRMGLNQASGR